MKSPDFPQNNAEREKFASPNPHRSTVFENAAFTALPSLFPNNLATEESKHTPQLDLQNN